MWRSTEYPEGSRQCGVSFCACIFVYCAKSSGFSVWSACCQLTRVSLVVVWIVCARSVLVFVVILVLGCSCGCGWVSSGCPSLIWMPCVYFCGVGDVVWWLDGLLPWCLVFVLAGSFFVGTSCRGEGVGCERARCAGLVW